MTKLLFIERVVPFNPDAMPLDDVRYSEIFRKFLNAFSSSTPGELEHPENNE